MAQKPKKVEKVEKKPPTIEELSKKVDKLEEIVVKLHTITFGGNVKL